MNIERAMMAGAVWLCAAAWTPGVVASAQGPGVTKLLPSDEWIFGRFGGTVSLCGDRSLVGASCAGAPHQCLGAAYIYDVSSAQELYRLQPHDPAVLHMFGHSVALSEEWALVSAIGDGDRGPDAGAVYVFDAVTGIRLRKIVPNDGTAGAWFGNAMSLEGDLVLIGAPGDPGDGQGCAYVFDVRTGQQLQKLASPCPVAGEGIGERVALSGGRALVATPYDPIDQDYSGTAYVFDVATGARLHQLLPPDEEYMGSFGASVAVAGDRALVGAPGDGEGGSLYVFHIETGQFLDRLVCSDPDERGLGISLSTCGDLALVGTWSDDSGWGISGSGVIFDVLSGVQIHKVRDPGWYWNSWFGASCSLSDRRALVGATYDEGHFEGECGAAYLIDIPSFAPGTSYCSGDLGSGACPCGNDNDGSLPGSGCDNGVFPGGAHLRGRSIASVSRDSLLLTATHAEPHNLGVFIQGDTAQSPGVVWGDGLRCVGGHLLTLQARVSDAQGTADSSVSISLAGKVMAGETRYYQYVYRAEQNPMCGAGVFEFNTSNGYAITWLP